MVHSWLRCIFLYRKAVENELGGRGAPVSSLQGFGRSIYPNLTDTARGGSHYTHHINYYMPTGFSDTATALGWFPNPLILADQLTLFHPGGGGADYTHYITNNWFRCILSLQKGGGYHLDLFIVAILIIICSLFGLPWFVAATVLSINHVRSLTRESESSAPGEKPQFLGIR